MKGAYKWFLLALLSFAFFFHQADRALFGLLTIPIQDDLKLTDVQIGWINTTLSWTLAAMTVVAGFLGDRFSRKWIITCSLIAWSLMTVCMGFIGGFVGALFFRSIATGVGESFYAPSAYALIAVHHTKTRSLALSIHQAALYIGLMVSGLIVAWALGFLGSWRHVFVAFGTAGALLGVFFIWGLRDGDGGQPASRPAAPSAREPLAAGLRAYFCNPSALCATAGFVAIVFVNNAYLFWAPKFAAQKFALDVGLAGKGVMLWHHLLAFGAILLGGVVTDRFVARMPRFRLGFDGAIHVFPQFFQRFGERAQQHRLYRLADLQKGSAHFARGVRHAVQRVLQRAAFAHQRTQDAAQQFHGFFRRGEGNLRFLQRRVERR